MVHFYGAVMTPPNFCLVSEFLPNGSLEDILIKRPPRPFSDRELVRMAMEAAAGVLHLHRENIIHRDIACRKCEGRVGLGLAWGRATNLACVGAVCWSTSSST